MGFYKWLYDALDNLLLIESPLELFQLHLRAFTVVSLI